MAWFPKLPEGVGPVRKFNTLMVVVITGTLLAQRFQSLPLETVQMLETVSTVAGIALFIGLMWQLAKKKS